MTDETRFKTEQEAFWAGDFGTEYIGRNEGPALLASNLAFFTRALASAGRLNSCVESGANVGMNLRALRLLYPAAELAGIEINAAWDGLANALIAQAKGFFTFDQAVEGSMVNYENLDNHQTGIHDYFKFLKFGFSRATDIACLHVRRVRISRRDGLEIVHERDGRFPWTYLGKRLEDILEPLDMTVDEFIRVCDQFTNKKIFKRDGAGALLKDRHGNLEKVNFDNA